jgi:hypothetical protein
VSALRQYCAAVIVSYQDRFRSVRLPGHAKVERLDSFCHARKVAPAATNVLYAADRA